MVPEPLSPPTECVLLLGTIAFGEKPGPEERLDGVDVGGDELFLFPVQKSLTNKLSKGI